MGVKKRTKGIKRERPVRTIKCPYCNKTVQAKAPNQIICGSEECRKRHRDNWVKEQAVEKGGKCLTCTKFDKRKNRCLVMKELIEDCWAWTDDKNWLKGVKKAVAEYRGQSGGMGNEN